MKIHAEEEEEDPVRENDKQKEVDACAMMMDTTMFDATNPMMEWLNEDEEHAILDGVDAASVVFEKIRFQRVKTYFDLKKHGNTLSEIRRRNPMDYTSTYPRQCTWSMPR